MVIQYSSCPTPSQVKGRQRRLLSEWMEIVERLSGRSDITVRVGRTNQAALPTEYVVKYDIRSICGIDASGTPLFAPCFTMKITLPPDYPQIDAPPEFHFVEADGSRHLPWHPNIRYYGDMAGRVCLNRLNTFTSIAWGIERVAMYLRYELYHALPTPPYPEDLKVAEWVRKQGEPNEWIFFDQDNR